MKKSILFSVVFALVMAVSVSAELKLGYVNSEVILSKYQGTKTAEEKLRQEYAKWEQVATEKQKSIKDMQEQLQKQALLLSEERKMEIQKDLQDSMVAYQQYLQQKFGQQGEAAKKNSELLKPIIAKINTIINDIAVKENYDFIFDTASGIVFAKKGYDLTEKVLARINSGK
jgi:outer membrane protein